MRERETLLSTLPEEVRDDAERLYTGSESDPHAIVAELHRRGLIRDSQLRDAVLALEATLRVGRMRSRPPSSILPSILGPLGAGAMGEVMLAKDEGLNRVVAVKRIHAELASRPAVMQRFYKEAQVTAQLDHPSIVPIHGLVESADGSLAYTMKLVRGRTLEDFLEDAREGWKKHGREEGELALPARLEVYLHVCDALAYAHERGVLHRDLKPENVMVGQFGQVMVMDWGIAKLVDGPGEEPIAAEEGASTKKVHGTRVGAVIGTPRYMSPEQAEGRNDILDSRSDQYSLGLILFELVTLRAAVSPDLDLDGCLEWAKAGRRQPISHLHRKGAIPRELAAIIDKATMKDRDRRYRTVGDLATDIRRFLRDEAVLAKPDSLFQKLLRWVGRHRSLMVMSLLSMALLLVVVAATLFVGGVSALEWRRRAAMAREDSLGRLLSATSSNAREINVAAHGVASLLTGLTFAGEASLDRPESALELGYDPVTEPPPRLKASPAYGRPISAERPSFVVPDGANPEELRGEIERLAVLSYQYARVLVDAVGREGDERLTRQKRSELILKEGSPIVWAKIATRTGVLATLPGTTSLQTGGKDPRKQAWYTTPSRGQGGITWTGPAVDPGGMGLVVTASLPLWDHKQDILGIAAADLGLDHLAKLIRTPAGTTEAFLVDGAGDKVAWKSMHADAIKAWDPKAVDPTLKAAIVRTPEGWGASGDLIYAWSPVPSLGWTYVVVGPRSLL